MRNSILWLVTMILLFAGCSGGKSPVTPDGQSNSGGSIDNLPVIGLTESDDGSFNALGLMGAYELQIDPVKVSAELVSKRMPSIGESWIVNGKSFFTISPCTTCLKIIRVALTSDNKLALTFLINHPFPPGDPLKPPTGKNRLDLDIFDVALVIKPLDATPTSYPLIGASAYTGILADNAGYTVELANLTGDNAALPYALVVDDSTSSTPTFNKFAMGQESSFNVFFNLTGITSLTFDTYLTMGYGASAKKAQRLIPTYFNPEFNRKSAWKVEVIPPEGTNPPRVGNTWDDNSSATPYPVTVKVWDWQQGVTDIANPPINPGDIALASDVASVGVEVPGMTTALQLSTTPSGGTGTPADPLVYTISFPNQNSLAVGTYVGLVKVTDTRVPDGIPTEGTIDYVIDVPGPGLLDNYPIPEFATYQAFNATVVTGNQPPTCDLVLSKYSVGSGETIFANPGTSIDPEGQMASYEYCTNYDGTNFVPAITQNSGSPDFGDPVGITLPCNTTGNPITVKIALRVCDGGGPPGQCTICSKDVTVGTKMGSPGDVTVTVNRGESGQAARLITSIDLDWVDNICAVEYSIERNDNGWDAASPPNPPNVWTEVGTSTTSDYKYVLANNDWDEDYRFRVIARAVSGGNPLTDSDPSEQIFVWFQSHAGVNASPQNNWISTSETGDLYFSTSWGYGDTLDSYGSGGWGCFCWGPPSINRWAVMRSPYPIPDLEGESLAWVEYYEQMCYADWSPTMGLTVGTISEVPVPGPTLYDFNPSNSVYPGCYAYNTPNVEGMNQEFGETNQAAWRYMPAYTVLHLGYYLNDLLDGPSGTRDWIAFGFANGGMEVANINPIWDCSDAWVIVVQ